MSAFTVQGARFEPQRMDKESRRYVDDPHIELLIDRNLRGGRLDVIDLDANDARRLALSLLIAAERSEGKQVPR